MSGPSGPEEEWVEAGAFRVDIGKALAKLERFQLKDPRNFLRCWLRVAVLSDAGKIVAQGTGATWTLEFDGDPLPEAAVEDPFAALFAAEAEAPERLRWLAVGLLGAHRLAPKRLAVRGGPAGIQSTFSDAWTSEVARCTPSPVTTLAVEWGARAPMSVDEFAAELTGAGRMLRAAFTLNGQALVARPTPAFGPIQEIEGRRLCLDFKPRDENVGIVLYRNGVRVERVEGLEFIGGVAVHIDDDGLALDLSAVASVKDARRAETIAMAVKVGRETVGLSPARESSGFEYMLALIFVASTIVFGPFVVFVVLDQLNRGWIPNKWESSAFLVGGIGFARIVIWVASIRLRRPIPSRDDAP